MGFGFGLKSLLDGAGEFDEKIGSQLGEPNQLIGIEGERGILGIDHHV